MWSVKATWSYNWPLFWQGSKQGQWPACLDSELLPLPYDQSEILKKTPVRSET